MVGSLCFFLFFSVCLEFFIIKSIFLIPAMLKEGLEHVGSEVHGNDAACDTEESKLQSTCVFAI